MGKVNTPHEILGLSRNATAEQIKRRYRELASKAHPDKGGTDEQFQALQAAYEAALQLPPVACETCEDTGVVLRPVTIKGKRRRGLVGLSAEEFVVRVPCPNCRGRK